MYPCTPVPIYHVHQIHDPNPQPSQPEAALVSVVLAPPLICSAQGEVQRRASTDILRCPTSTSKKNNKGPHGSTPRKTNSKHQMVSR